MADELTEDIPDSLLRLFLKNLQGYALFTLSSEGRITTWNSTAERLFGYPRTEMLGEHVARLYLPHDVRQGVPDRELAEAQSKGQASDDRWLVRRDGSRFWASGVTTVLHEQTLKGFAKFIRDLTPWKQAHEEALRLNEQLKAQVAAYQQVVQELEGVNLRLATTNQQLAATERELREKVEELEQFEQAVVGRELKMMQLERELERLRRHLGAQG